MPFFSRRSVPSDVSARAAATSVEQPQKALIKVALLGDGGVGKTSLMARYIEGAFDRGVSLRSALAQSLQVLQ